MWEEAEAVTELFKLFEAVLNFWACMRGECVDWRGRTCGACCTCTDFGGMQGTAVLRSLTKWRNGVEAGTNDLGEIKVKDMGERQYYYRLTYVRQPSRTIAADN